jgi:VWFA-related protein
MSPRLFLPSHACALALLAGLSLPAAAQSSTAPSSTTPSVSSAPEAPGTQAAAQAQAAPTTPGGAVPTPAPATDGVPGAPNAQAGQPAAAGQDGFTIKRDVNEVNLTFTVTDHRGRFINNLQQQDFALLDNQRAPAQVYRFSQQTDQPLRVGLVIDASTSIRSRFQFEQQAATEFLLDILRPRTDRAFIMGFDVSAYVTQGFTNNPDLLESGLTRLKPGGGTALYDAIYHACRDQMLNGVPRDVEVRKVIILVSDGDDNQSRAYLDDAIKMCQRAETTIYTISTNTSPSRERGDETLKKMAEATGGSAFYPQRLEDIANEFKKVEEELRSQYQIAYKPADFRVDGSFRTIYLTSLRNGYTVHARSGYFAPR